MHTFVNIKTGREYGIPSDVSELRPRQLLFYVKLMLMSYDGEIDFATYKLLLYRKLTGLRLSHRFYAAKPDRREALLDAVRRNAESMRSFFDVSETEHTFSPRGMSGRNPLPRIRLRQGPADMLVDLPWGCFCNCVKACADTKDADRAKFRRTVSYVFDQLYRPVIRFIRLPVPFEAQYAAFLFFRAVLDLLYSSPVTVNGREIDFGILFKSDKKEKSDGVGWDGLRLAVAEAGVFGTLNQTDNQPLWDVLIYLYKTETDRRELEKKTTEK